MAAPIVQYTVTADPIRALANATARVRAAINDFGNARNAIIGYINGTTTDPTHFDRLVAACGIQAGDYATPGAAAVALFSQLDSLYQKLTAPSGQGDATGAALAQFCQLLGIV